MREGIKAIGLKLFVDDLYASPTVTAIDISNLGFNLQKVLKSNYNITLAGGQKKLKNRIIRIGHLGYVDRLDIIVVLSALEMALKDKNIYGKGVRAAELILSSGGED